MARPTLAAAVAHVKKHGVLLVFPLANRSEPNSLWRCFYPRTAMRWEWSEDADDRVPQLWHLREELSRSRRVVYVKWYQGRATLFSKELFTAVLSRVSRLPDPTVDLSFDARSVLDALEDNSPLPTRKLRAMAEMEGRANEGRFNRALRELWRRFLVVGFGEEEEGGFPSLSIGSTRVLFEDLWDASMSGDHEPVIERFLPLDSLFGRAYQRTSRIGPIDGHSMKLAEKRSTPAP